MSKQRKRPLPPPPTPRTKKAIAICALATLALLAADLGTKAWAEEALAAERVGESPPVCEPDEFGRVAMQRVRAESIVVVEGYVMYRYAENCGAAFGLLRDAPPLARKVVFGFAAAAASLVLFVMFIRGRGQVFFAWSVPMIVSGALGNLVDRARYGYVVDFIRVHLQDGPEWPTFNIADIGITVGVILLVLDGFREVQLDRAREKAAEGVGTKRVGKKGDGKKAAAASSD